MTDWPVKTLGEVCEVLDNLRKPITKRDRTSGGYPYYGATGIVDHVGDYIFDERLVLVGEDGAKWGAGERTAFIAEGKYWVNNHAHVLRCKQGVLVDSWLANFLTMSDLNRYVSGLTVPKLNQGSLVSIEIPVPPLEEQKRIVALLDAATARVTELTASYKQARSHANNLFISALRHALEGNPDWPVKTLGDVCDLVGGGTPSKDRPDFYGGDIPWATIRDLNVEVLRSTEHSITAEALTSSSSNVIPAGSVVIATRVGLGKAVIIAQDTAINQDLRGLVVKNPKEVLADYLFWWYLSSIHLVVAAGTGATVQGVKLPFVSGLVIPVPSLEEQKRIVAGLDSMKAKTSEMVVAYDAKLTAAKNLRQSILEAAFAGDL